MYVLTRETVLFWTGQLQQDGNKGVAVQTLQKKKPYSGACRAQSTQAYQTIYSSVLASAVVVDDALTPSCLVASTAKVRAAKTIRSKMDVR